MSIRRSRDWNDDEVRSWHARYFLGEASVTEIALGESPAIAPAMVYYHFARLGLKLKNGSPPSIARLPEGRRLIPFAGANVEEPIRNVLAEAERPGPVPKRPFSGPPIYRSEFIRGDAERKMRAGR